MPIDGVPAEPDRRMVGNLGRIVTDLIANTDAASAAVLLARPGPAPMTDGDRRWATALDLPFGGAGRRWPVHLAIGGQVRVVAPDDLIGVGPA